MAEKNLLLSLLFLLISLSLYLPSTLSHPTTALFDVSASLLRTRHVTSPHTSKTLNHKQSQQATSPLSLSLHPRSSLHKPHTNDYESLTHSRLARDSARIKFIHSHIELTHTGSNVTSSVLTPNGLETPLTSGKGQGVGEYFARLAVGNPPREYYLSADTGSDVIWLQCSPCSECYQQSDPIFDPSRSSTYRSLSCDSAQCRQLEFSDCQAGSCLYGLLYGDGSFTKGNFATETLTFGNSGAANEVAIGCGHDNEGLFMGSAGLLGLGGGSLSLTSQLKATSFSYCLVDRDSSGSSTLEFNSGRPGDSITARLIQNPRVRTYRYVDFSGFVVGGRMVQIPSSVFAIDETGRGGVIVDSGTTITRLKTEAYNPLRDAFASMARDLPKTGGDELFDTCYDLSGRPTVSVPTLGFVFAGSKVLQLPPKNYLIPVNSQGKHCFAFAPTNEDPSIIGNVQQEGMRVSYDLANSVVGFSPSKC